MTRSFTPGADNTRALRQAFGRFATGVTVVTTAGAAGPVGITANSFTAVSLDPPLLLWCPAKASQRHETFVGAPRFALHVMGAGQDAISRAFATTADAFDRCAHSISEHGVPLLEGCPVRFECAIRDRIDAGDHTVIIGLVEQVSLGDGAEPQVFLGGEYGRFTADPPR